MSHHPTHGGLMPKTRFRTPPWTRRYRTLYRVSSGGHTLAFNSQKREAVRVASRHCRGKQQAKPTIDVHVADRGRRRWVLIAQVRWSSGRQAPALQEL